MGRESFCKAEYESRTAQGTALLEEKEIRFRSQDRSWKFRIPLGGVKGLDVRGGALHLRFDKGMAVLHLGMEAEKWAQKIRNPRSRLEKLGVKPESEVAVTGFADAAFLAELRSLLKGEGQLRSRLPSGTRGLDLIFFLSDSVADLSRLGALRRHLQPAGGLWVLWPKGQAHIREDDIRRAAKQAGLTDVKVCAFSESLSALKLVIPRGQR